MDKQKGKKQLIISLVYYIILFVLSIVNIIVVNEIYYPGYIISYKFGGDFYTEIYAAVEKIFDSLAALYTMFYGLIIIVSFAASLYLIKKIIFTSMEIHSHGKMSSSNSDDKIISQ